MKNSRLTALHIGNFKAVGQLQTIPIRPITMIFGPNSAGKSTIIQSLILAHEIQIAQRGRVAPDVDVHQTQLGGSTVDLGGFRQFLHGANAAKKVELGLQFELDKSGTADGTVDGPDTVLVSTHLGLEDNKGEFYDEKKERAYSRLKEALSIHAGTFDDGFDLSNLSTAQGADVRLQDRSARVSIISVSLNAEVLIRLSFLGVNSSTQCLMSADHLSIRHPFVRQIIDSIKCSEEFSRLSEGHVLMDEEIDAFLAATSPQFRSQGLGVAELLAAKDSVSDAGVPIALRHLSRQFWREIITFLSRVDEGLTNALRNMVYLGPFRAVPTRNFAGIGSDNGDWRSGGGAAWEELLSNESAREAANDWLARLELPHQLVVSATVTLDEIERSLREYFCNNSPKRPTPDALNELARKYAEQAKALEAHRSITGASLDKLIDDEEEFNSDTYQAALNDADELTKTIQREANSTSHLRLVGVRNKKEVSFRDVGTGTSQLLPILATALTSSRAVIAIEQPELHLHPGLQSDLGDLFIDSALGERTNTFLLETHSEHLMLRLLRRIRETTNGTLGPDNRPVHPEDVQVIYVVPAGEGETSDRQSSTVVLLPICEDGEFSRHWPRGFFTDREEDLFS